MTNYKELSIILGNCKTANEIYKVMNIYFSTNNINDKYSQALQRNLKKEIDFDKAMQTAWNYILNSEFPMKMHDVGKSRWKGTAIHGMECSNSYR